MSGHDGEMARPEKSGGFSMCDYLLEKYGPVMRSNDVSEFLKCHPSHVRAMCQEGELPAIQIGKRWFVSSTKLGQMFEGDGDAYVGK